MLLLLVDDLSQIQKRAVEQNQVLVDEYLQRITRYSAEQLVFVDESACDRRTYIRNRGWAFAGERVTAKRPFSRGKRWVILRPLSSLFLNSFLFLDSRFSQH